MSVDYLAHDLFLLMLTLSQIKSETRILTVFLEAMNNIQPNIHLRLLSEGEEAYTETVELATANNSFGYIVLEGTLAEQPNEILSLIRNAIRMLAVILEKRFHETLLEDKNLRLETVVADRTAELLQANKLLKNEITERRQAEEASRESEEKFRSLFDNINIGVAVHEIITDKNNKAIDFIFLDANPTYEHLTQLKAVDIVGKRGLEVIPNLEQRWIDIYGEVAKTGKAITIIDHSDYLDKYWEVKAYSPKKNQFAVALSDITERKQAEDALRENEKLLRQIAANYPNSYLSIIEKDFTAGFTSGQEFQKQNLDPEQFVGLTLEQIFGDKAPLIKEYYQKTFNGAEQTFELFVKNQYQYYRTVPLYAENGSIPRILSVVENITERKQTEAALRESEKKLSTLFEVMTEMLVIHDLVLDDQGQAVDYRITDCNQAYTRITGIRREDAIGKLATKIYQTETAPYLEEYSRVALTGEPHEYTTYYAPMDKHFMISVVSPQKGQFATITTDITALKQIEAIVSAKNKELESYLYVASHDLRSPLVNIQGFSQRLQKQTNAIKQAMAECSLDPETRQQIETITDKNIPQSLDFIFTNVSKMDTLISGLLQISRTGRVQMTITAIDMNALIKSVVQAFSFQIDETATQVRVKKLPPCYGDEKLLNQLFSNIISNALKYRDTDRPLVVTISGQAQYNKVVYRIKDTGIGLAPRYREKIWDVFYRVDARAPEAGEGIGLSIVKRIVDKHKGRVWVESEAGKGTEFYIELQGNEFSE